MGASVEIIGATELAAKFNACVAACEAQKNGWIMEAGGIVQTSIEERIQADGLVKTGALLASGRTFEAGEGAACVGFGAGLDYAPALELGAMPHSIDAKNAPTLAFYWERAGRMFYGPHINHPGNRPYAFMRNGTELSLVPLAFMFMGKLRAIFGSPL